MTRVSVLGLGRMGAAMAAALCAAGHEVTVWNRSEGGYSRLREELGTAGSVRGPRRARTAAEAVANAEVVIAMLADGRVVLDVLFGESAVAAALPVDAVFCDMGTGKVSAAFQCATRLAASGRQFLDAPVSGSVSTVRAGQLLVMAGGRKDVVRRVEPLFGAFAARVVHVGDTGSGQVMKLSVNAIVHILDGALSEALVLAERGGVDRAMALKVISESVVGAPFVQYKRAAFEEPGQHPVAFTIDLMIKDLELVIELARERESPVPLTSAVASVAQAASAAGLGQHDMSELAVFLRRHHEHSPGAVRKESA